MIEEYRWRHDSGPVSQLLATGGDLKYIAQLPTAKTIQVGDYAVRPGNLTVKEDCHVAWNDLG